MLGDALLHYIGFTKAIEDWMHAAHHLTKGPSFIANHELLFGRIYQTFSEDFDRVVEKIVYLTDDEKFACPKIVSEVSSKILSSYDSPANMSERSIGMVALCMIVDHMKGIEVTRELLKKEDMLTLGMDDLLTSSSNQYENYAYMLNQYTKEM
tara:strand:+ start:2179 stop:2637 length:459 start_codon:yes stop_codon:yes gene_type:complete